jgi:hypothetical protein
MIGEGFGFVAITLLSGVACAAPSGGSIVSSGMARLDPKHRDKAFGRLYLPDPAEVCCERHDITATCACDSEIRPPPGPHVDLEGARSIVGTTRIAGDVFGAFGPPAGKPAS